MNKSSIKNYAVWARNELIERVSQKAYEYGVTESSLPDYNTDKVNGRLLSNDENYSKWTIPAFLLAGILFSVGINVRRMLLKKKEDMM